MPVIIFLFLTCMSLFAKEITITSEDGFVMHGWLDYPAQKKAHYPIVLFAHQFGADHTIWKEMAGEFNQKGYATLMVDIRGHGKSIMKNGIATKVSADIDNIASALEESRKSVRFEKITSDLSQWLNKLSGEKEIDMHKLILVGSSLGAGAIIPLMVEADPIALIALSPGGGDEEAIKTSLMYSETPSLFIAGKDDTLGAQERAIAYTKEALRGSLVLISSDGHGVVLLPRVKPYIDGFLKLVTK